MSEDEMRRSQDPLIVQYYESEPSVWPEGNVDVCYTSTAWSTWPSSTKELIEDALKSSWQRFANVTFAGFGPCGGSETWTLVFEHQLDGANTSHYGPLEYPAPTHNVTVAFNGTKDPESLYSTVIHEVGHAIGLEHSMATPLNFDTNGNPRYCILTYAAIEGEELNDRYDQFSILNYCAHGLRDWRGIEYYHAFSGGLSFDDIRGVQELYGARTSSIWFDAAPAILSLL